MQHVWHHTFYNELRVSPEEHCVLVLEAPLSPKAQREEILRIMFGAFHVPSAYVDTQASMIAYSAGQSTGVVLDSGHGATHAMPICGGHLVPHAIRRFAVAGSHLTGHLAE